MTHPQQGVAGVSLVDAGGFIQTGDVNWDLTGGQNRKPAGLPALQTAAITQESLVNQSAHPPSVSPSLPAESRSGPALPQTESFRVSGRRSGERWPGSEPLTGPPGPAAAGGSEEVQRAETGSGFRKTLRIKRSRFHFYRFKMCKNVFQLIRMREII